MASNFQETAVKTVIVERKRLASTLASNLETHQREFAESRRGYESTRLDLIRKVSEAARNASAVDNEINRKALHEAYGTFSSLEKPVDHSNEYKQAINLMEWETRDKVELSINDFESYVQDNWGWKRQFKLVHDSYSVSGR